MSQTPSQTDVPERLSRLIDALQPERLTRVLDIGANPINAAPYAEPLKAGLAEVWGFEPQESAFDKLEEIRGPNEYYLPHAVGDGKQANLNVCRSGGFTSLFKPNAKTQAYLGRWRRAMQVTETVSFETKRLDDLSEVPKPDLLKIDVQGAEAMVFRNGQETLSEAVAIITEVAFVPLYENQPLLHEQAAILYDYGFLMNKFLFIKSKALGSPLMAKLNPRRHQNQAIDGDAVFIRSLLDPALVSDEQLKHLAICADSVFGSYDLVAKCLSLLIARGSVTEEAALRYLHHVPHQNA